MLCFVVLNYLCCYSGPLGKKKEKKMKQQQQKTGGTVGSKTLSLVILVCQKVNEGCHCKTEHCGLWVGLGQAGVTTPAQHIAKSWHPPCGQGGYTGSLGWWHASFEGAMSLLWSVAQNCLPKCFFSTSNELDMSTWRWECAWFGTILWGNMAPSHSFSHRDFSHRWTYNSIS